MLYFNTKDDQTELYLEENNQNEKNTENQVIQRVAKRLWIIQPRQMKA